jgi:hypothetical protein
MGKVKIKYEDVWGSGGIAPSFLASTVDGVCLATVEG